MFLAANLTGRGNIWRTDADGKWLYFRQDNGGDEYYDIYRVLTGGGAAEQFTQTRSEAHGRMV